MPYKLIPPGRRHGNRFWYGVITAPGVRREVSLKTTDKAMAEQYARKLDADLYKKQVLRENGVTVSEAIDRYILFRRPRKSDEQNLLNIGALIGDKPGMEVTQQDFDDCAVVLYPKASNETRNREVYTPLQAALRHSGITLRVSRPKQKRPRHRSLTMKQRDTFIEAATDPDLKALLCLMFFTGCRISEAISLTWDRVDFESKSVLLDMTKTESEAWCPLHKRAVVALANLRKKKRKGARVFRWETKAGPRKPIAKLCEATGIKFNPHMARHTFADLLMESGASLRDLMEAGRWSDAKSAMRYTGRKQERLRKRIAKL